MRIAYLLLLTAPALAVSSATCITRVQIVGAKLVVKSVAEMAAVAIPTTISLSIVLRAGLYVLKVI